MIIKSINCVNKETKETQIININERLENFENIFDLKKNFLRCDDVNIFDKFAELSFKIKVDDLDNV